MMYFCWLSAFHIKDILLISAGKTLQKRWRFAICLYMAMATIEIEIDTGSTWIENEGGGLESGWRVVLTLPWGKMRCNQ